MKNLLHNWKTSLVGSGSIAMALASYQQNPNDLKTPIIFIVLGALGLIASDGKKPPLN